MSFLIEGSPFVDDFSDSWLFSDVPTQDFSWAIPVYWIENKIQIYGHTSKAGLFLESIIREQQLRMATVYVFIL